MNKILISDDDEAIQVLYADALTEEGFVVVVTGDDSGLLELIAQERPDLIVLEIKLGEYSRLDLLQDIRNTYHNLPVILCTAYSIFKYDLRSIAADYSVMKSADLKELREKIKMAFEAHERFLAKPTPPSVQHMPNPRQYTY